jgi:hypothetical protein
MKTPVLLALAALVLGACDVGGGGVTRDGSPADPPRPILAVNGTISAVGRTIVPSYGVAGLNKSGSAVGIIMSDASMGCAALTSDYASRNLPEEGTYLSVGIPSFDQGVAAKSFVQFMMISALGNVSGGGANSGTVEVLPSPDAAVTVRIDFHDALSGGDYLVSGAFTVSRCP